MDTKFQDIHLIRSKTQENIFVLRCVEIEKIDFAKPAIVVTFLENKERKILILPKLLGYSLLID